jgi:hypothetical protein
MEDMAPVELSQYVWPLREKCENQDHHYVCCQTLEIDVVSERWTRNPGWMVVNQPT